MSTVATLSLTDVKQQIAALRAQFEEARRQSEEAERKGREIDQQIRNLQAQCPHEHTKEDFVQDVAEMKLRTFCTDCGAQC